MSSRGINRMSCVPNFKEKRTISHKQDTGKKAVRNSSRFAGSCRFKLPKTLGLSPVKFLMHLGHKVAAALRLKRRTSTKVSSSGRSRPFVAPVDSHRTEAIEDCIQFINSSSSLQRSNSVPPNPC